MDNILYFKNKNGWRIKPLLKSNGYSDYVIQMAEVLKKTNPSAYNRPKLEKPSGISREDWILSMQSKSTQEIINKQKDPSYSGRNWTEELPENVIAIPNALTKEELVNERDLTFDEISHVESIRRRPKNSIGQSDLSSASEESKARAIDHFRSHPSLLESDLTDSQLSSIKKLNDLLNGAIVTSPQYEWRKMSFWKAIKHWLKGGKIRRD